MKYYLLKSGQITGPFTEAEVRSRIASGQVDATDSFAVEGDAAWKPLSQLAPVLPAVPGAPPVPPLVPPAHGYRADPHALPASASGPTSNLAIAALVCGGLSLFCGIGAIAAIILGHMALAELKRNPTLRGREMAQIGLALGYIILGLSLLGIIFMVFFNAGAALFGPSLIHSYGH